jgi:predicted nucleic acid-binding protein
MHIAILDTSVYIGHWERGLYEETLESVRQVYIVRQSAVVLSELRRGARTRDWWEAGRLVRQLGDEQGWEHHKRREFQNDALIALTARRYGATVVTANLSDFALLARSLRIQILGAK